MNASIGYRLDFRACSTSAMLLRRAFAIGDLTAKRDKAGLAPFPKTADFLSFIIQANAGNDTVNYIKQAAEFGIMASAFRPIAQGNCSLNKA